MIRKISILGVLKDQYSILSKQISLKDELYNLLATLQVVGSIREDQVKLLGTTLQIEEYVSLNSVEIVELKLARRLAYKVMVYAIHLHRGHTASLTRGKLIAYRACAGEEVEYIQLLDIHKVDKDIK